MDAPLYPCRPIRSVRALSLALGESEELLHSLASRSSNLYRHVPQVKKDGSRRDTYDAYRPLKAVQRKIVDRLLAKVFYPLYLHGGIKDPVHRRSIYSNARIHAGASALVLQDIKDFYPSITAGRVQEMFEGALGFSNDVARVLALLTTRHEVVPQGASTSGYIANLVFWDIEPALVARLQAEGLSYSRFADDITISSKAALESPTLSRVISSVTQMLASKGCHQRRSKLHIRKRGQQVRAKADWEPLTVTGLSIFNPSPGIPKRERRAIRAAVKQLEDQVSTIAWPQLEPKLLSAMGRIGRLIACGHPDGEQLMRRARVVKTQALGCVAGHRTSCVAENAS